MVDKNPRSPLPATSEKLEIIRDKIIVRERLENMEFRNCMIVESTLFRCKFYDCVFEESKIRNSKVETSIGIGTSFDRCVLVRSPGAPQPSVRPGPHLEGSNTGTTPHLQDEITSMTLRRLEFLKKTWGKLPTLFLSPKHTGDQDLARLLSAPNHIIHHHHIDE
jgi:hypothetical protein